MDETWNLPKHQRRRTDWWKRAGILIAGGSLILACSSASITLVVKFVDWRVSEQIGPVRESLARIEGALGIPSPAQVAAAARR